MENDAGRDATFAKLFEQWQREAREFPPSLDDVAEMMAHIRACAAFDRDVFSKWEPPDQLAAAQGCLRAVLVFLQKQSGLVERGDLAPLLRLNGALSDLAVGRVSDLLKPAKKKAGRRGVSSQREFLQAMGARTLSELVEAGDDLDLAASRVARALQAKRRDMSDVSAATVVNWRERLRQGPGRGASEEAVQQYNMSLPDRFGATPRLRGEALLKALAKRGDAIG
jgi:hypothetical protein